jgi:hypothetical protein
LFCWHTRCHSCIHSPQSTQFRDPLRLDQIPSSKIRKFFFFSLFCWFIFFVAEPTGCHFHACARWFMRLLESFCAFFLAEMEEVLREKNIWCTLCSFSTRSWRRVVQNLSA